jgi:hypothetical protein
MPAVAMIGLLLAAALVAWSDDAPAAPSTHAAESLRPPQPVGAGGGAA